MNKPFLVLLALASTPAFAAAKYPGKVECEVVQLGDKSAGSDVYLYNTEFTLAMEPGHWVHTDVVPQADLTITSYISAGEGGLPPWIRVNVGSTKTGETMFMHTLDLVSTKVPLMLHVDFPKFRARVDCRTK